MPVLSAGLTGQALPVEDYGRHVAWPGQRSVTFSDALTYVRRRLWREWVLPRAGLAVLVATLSPGTREPLMSSLTLAA